MPFKDSLGETFRLIGAPMPAAAPPKWNNPDWTHMRAFPGEGKRCPKPGGTLNTPGAPPSVHWCRLFPRTLPPYHLPLDLCVDGGHLPIKVLLRHTKPGPKQQEAPEPAWKPRDSMWMSRLVDTRLLLLSARRVFFGWRVVRNKRECFHTIQAAGVNAHMLKGGRHCLPDSQQTQYP